MTAETGSGPPTPACWASMSMVSGAVETCGRGRERGARPGLAMPVMCRGVGVKKPADPAREAPQALGCRDWEGLPGTRPVGRRGCLSAGNGAALGSGWPPGGGRTEAGRRARRVARRLGWHRHQLPVPLPQRARGGRGRRLLQSAPVPVPVRARQGEASRGLWGRAGWGSGLRGGRNSVFLPAQAPSLVYGGHGSHVTSVRFTHDDSHLISLGGKDASIFQWRVLGAGGAGPAPATPSRTPSLSPASSLDV